MVPVVDHPGGERALLLPAGECSFLDRRDLAVLGERDGIVYLAAEPPLGELAALAAARGARLAELKPLGGVLPAWEAGLLAYASGLLHWHRTSRFCGACGSATAPRDAGHRRDCGACGHTAFPRTDAAVIGLVTRGERCLLVNQPQWPPHRLATVAGFVEPGESLEESMAREVREEVGLEVGGLRYVASQPWPFPASLMVGYTAAAAPGELRLSPEIRAARWLAREELADALRTGEITLATPVSISFHLIAGWYGDPAALLALSSAAQAAAPR
jgi:NAD+ diphosphatase